jgi:glycosyltransferase involved in cell wall biosynthesis
MSNLLLTYIVPVYNTEAYVLQCLQSIVGQGLDAEDYEVLAVDDGSTDTSLAVVEAFAREHTQVRLLTQANKGVSAARNLALDNARGRYVMFVDSDDRIKENAVPRLLKRAMDESLDVLSFNYSRMDVDGNQLPHTRDDNYATTAVTTGYEFLKTHSMTPYVWRFIVRRDYLEQGKWRFDPSLIVCEDGALIAQFLLNAPRVAHEGQEIYCYVNRADSAMHNPDRDHLRRRICSQVDSAASIDATARQFESQTGRKAPASVDGVRNVYLYFSMTKALTTGFVDEILERIRKAGLFPFPCVGPEADYYGVKWKIIHLLMMRPILWRMLSKVYSMIRR